MNDIATIADIKSLIYVVRGQQVMLDANLAALYGYATKQFNREVKNNAEKFDADFMFRLTEEDVANLRCKNCTSRWGGSRYVILDFNTSAEKIYHCGSSSKDGGNRVMTIEEVSDNAIYRPLITRLAKNGVLMLKPKGGTT